MVRKIVLVGLVVFLLALLQPPVGAQPDRIKPGGTYTINVTVNKSPFVNLEADKWEIRAYFYSGTSNFCTGSWSEYAGRWIHSGWWKHRAQPDTWRETPEIKTFSIQVAVVGHPRPAEDIQRGMTEIPIGEYLTLRVRLLIKKIEHEVRGSYVWFKVGGVEYLYPFEDIGYNRLKLKTEEFYAYVDKDDDRLVFDQDQPILVDNAALPAGTITVLSPINVGLEAAGGEIAPYEIPFEYKVLLAVIVALGVVGGIVAIVMKGRRPPEGWV